MGDVVDFAERTGKGPRRRLPPDSGNFSARDRSDILNAIMRRAGHHVRLSSLISRIGALDEVTARSVAIHVSHYILSGKELPPAREIAGPRS
jgi:hypothetical protein